MSYYAYPTLKQSEHKIRYMLVQEIYLPGLLKREIEKYFQVSIGKKVKRFSKQHRLTCEARRYYAYIGYVYLGLSEVDIAEDCQLHLSSISRFITSLRDFRTPKEEELLSYFVRIISCILLPSLQGCG